MIQRRSIESLELSHITFGYLEGAPVFRDVSVKLPEARATWVRSVGGRGKSTFLRLLMGQITPQSGQYLLNGEDVLQMSFEEFLPFKLNMGFGFDMGGLINNKTLSDNLVLPLVYHGFASLAEATSQVSQLTDHFGLQGLCNQRPFEVSGSIRKLTCILRAFVHSPQIVLLDEPLTGLQHEHLQTLLTYIDSRFAEHGLKKIYFTAEGAELAQSLKAQELLLSMDGCTARAVA